jgi:hypothetical protein
MKEAKMYFEEVEEGEVEFGQTLEKGVIQYPNQKKGGQQ